MIARALCLAFLFIHSTSHAQDMSADEEATLFTTEASVAIPLTYPQAERFHHGPSLAIGGLRSLNSVVLLGGHYRATMLPAVSDDADPRYEDVGAAGLHAVSGVFRLRPFGLLQRPQRGTGLFVELAGGAGLTQILVRPVLEVGLGYGIKLGALDVSPMVRYVQVVQGDTQVDPNDALLFYAGLEIALFDNRPSSGEPVWVMPPVRRARPVEGRTQFE